MHFRQEIGKWGEKLACQYLKENNYNIIEKNFFCRQGEIDIIAKDNQKQELVFVEVKTRSNLRYGNPIDSVNKQKQRHIKRVANYYLYKTNSYKLAVRVDVIEIYLQPSSYKINHIKQIF